MNKRKDYIYLADDKLNTQDPEISFDFSGQEAEKQYCSVIARQQEEVILTNGQIERDARVARVVNGVASFQFEGRPRPVSQIFLSEEK